MESLFSAVEKVEEQKVCERCGKLHPVGELQVVGANMLWCGECVKTHAWRCFDCGNFFPISLTIPQYVYCYPVCDKCIELNYYYCNRCERYVDSDEWDSHSGCCYDCADDNYSEYISEYHSQSQFKFYGDMKKRWNNLWRGLGVELEIDTDNDRDEDILASRLLEIAENRIYLERDCSLDNGFEIITYPHTLEDFKNINWKDILKTCQDYGYESHDAGNCGLHIHFSRNMFGSNKVKQDNAISKVMYFYEKNWNDIVKLSRRTDSQINEWAGSFGINLPKDAKRCCKDKNNVRYLAINNLNENTVEFRMGRGTLNIESFNAWIDFNKTLVINSRKIAWKEIENKEKWLKGLSKETRTYLNRKNLFIERGELICA